jgi:hypothetical protein
MKPLKRTNSGIIIDDELINPLSGHTSGVGFQAPYVRLPSKYLIL